MIPLPRLPAYYLRADNMPDEYTQTVCRVQKCYSCWILHEALLLLGTRFFSHRNLIKSLCDVYHLVIGGSSHLGLMEFFLQGCQALLKLEILI